MKNNNHLPFPFPNKANQIASVYWQHSQKSIGPLLQGYSELAFVIQEKPGFCQEHKINIKDSTITLKHSK